MRISQDNTLDDSGREFSNDNDTSRDKLRADVGNLMENGAKSSRDLLSRKFFANRRIKCPCVRLHARARAREGSRNN